MLRKTSMMENVSPVDTVGVWSDIDKFVSLALISD